MSESNCTSLGGTYTGGRILPTLPYLNIMLKSYDIEYVDPQTVFSIVGHMDVLFIK